MAQESAVDLSTLYALSASTTAPSKTPRAAGSAGIITARLTATQTKRPAPKPRPRWNAIRQHQKEIAVASQIGTYVALGAGVAPVAVLPAAKTILPKLRLNPYAVAAH